MISQTPEAMSTNLQWILLGDGSVIHASDLVVMLNDGEGLDGIELKCGERRAGGVPSTVTAILKPSAPLPAK